MSFRDELEELLNKHSMEGGSGTPDFILAQYLCNCLAAFNTATEQRARWYGLKDMLLSKGEPPSGFQAKE